MEITKELQLSTFNFWSGAKNHSFTYSELNEIENSLEELYPEGTSETTINNLFWFEEEFICECIGLDFEEYEQR